MMDTDGSAPLARKALVRGESVVIISSDDDVLQLNKTPDDKIYSYFSHLPAEAETSLPFPPFHDVDHSLGLVTLVHPHTQMNDRQWREFTRIQRVIKYPSVNDQIGSIMRQFDAMRQEIKLTDEMEHFISLINQVKSSLPYKAM